MSNPSPEVQYCVRLLMGGGHSGVVNGVEAAAEVGIGAITIDLNMMRALLLLASEAITIRQAPVKMRFGR